MAKSKPPVKKPETIEETRAEVALARAEFEAAKLAKTGKPHRDEMARVLPEWKRFETADKTLRALERHLRALEKAAKVASETVECQVCERHQKATRSGDLVHHGYQRPGWGSIIGDCYGAGYAPFPAHDRLDIWLVRVREEIESVKKYLATLATAKTVTRMETDYKNFVSRGRGYGKKPVIYEEPKTKLPEPTTKYDEDRETWSTYFANKREWEKWEQVVNDVRRTRESEISGLEREAARVAARIKAAKAAASK